MAGKLEVVTGDYLIERIPQYIADHYPLSRDKLYRYEHGQNEIILFFHDKKPQRWIWSNWTGIGQWLQVEYKPVKD